VVCLFGTAFVGSADAKMHRYTKAQRTAISKKLTRAVKKNPRVISKRWFLKKASLVNFTLPTTIRLLPAKNQQGGFANNDSQLNGPNNPALTTGSLLGNYASIDLGPSLGVRTIGLGGTIKANINFNDAFDGGNLGDVRLSIPSGGTLTTTSVPLLANPNTSDAINHLAPEDELDRVFTDGLAATPGVITVTATAPTAGSTTIPSYNPATFSRDVETALAKLDSVCGYAGAATNPCPQNVYAYSIPANLAFPGLPANVVETLWMIGGTQSGVSADVSFTGSPLTSDPTLSAGGVTGTPPLNSSRLVSGTKGTVDADGQGGCGDFKGNGGAVDVDYLSAITNSNDPSVANLGDGPALLPSADYGGSSNVQDSVLRTGPINLSVLAGGTSAVVPGDNGMHTTKVGASGGKANLFGGTVDGLSGNSVDVTIGAVSGTINAIARQVDGGFPSPAGAPTSNETKGNLSAYFNCRQAWTGGMPNTLTDLKLKGKLSISPALTADGHVRIAKVYLTGNGSSRQALAACLSPYQLYMSGNPSLGPSLGGLNPLSAANVYESTSVHGGAGTTGALDPGGYLVGPQLIGTGSNQLNPLAILLGSALGTSKAPAGPLGIAPGTRCDADGGPLTRSPFNFKRIAPAVTTVATSGALAANDVNDLLNAGAAVAVSGDLTVNRVRAEVLVGQGF